MSKKIAKIILKNWILQKRSFGAHLATNRIYRKSQLTVISGPFKGLEYVENSTGGAYFPKLLGVYEKELNSIYEELRKVDFKKVVNVGGGEGYFAIGLARMFPNATVDVFEPGFYGCFLIEKMAKQNKVANRVKINAKLCFETDLQKSIEKNEPTLVVMDVEGAELQLLNPATVSGLSHSHIVVEIHDTVSPTLGQTIIDRFANTHKLTEVWQEARSAADLPISPGMLKKSLVKLLDEGRGYKMRWFYFEPLK